MSGLEPDPDKAEPDPELEPPAQAALLQLHEHPAPQSGILDWLRGGTSESPDDEEAS